MKKLKGNRGFTLIELLVVVFIIGILTAFIIVNISSARNRSLDKSVQSNLDSVRARAEITYDNNANAGSYITVCADENVAKSVQQALNATKTTSGTYCLNSENAWVAWAPLVQGGFWCVDYKRTSSAYMTTATAPTSGSIQCPATGQTTLGGSTGSGGRVIRDIGGEGGELIVPRDLDDGVLLQEGEVEGGVIQGLEGRDGEFQQEFQSF